MIERDVMSVCHALLALQNQCFKFQEGSSNLARREEALQNYNEICLDAKAKATVSSKYAKLMISNAGFQEAIQATKASLAHPLMDLILSSFRTHGALASDLAHEVNQTCT